MPAYPPKSILVPVDFSKPSLSALETAKDLSRRFRCPLELVHVQEFVPDALGPLGAADGLLARQWREHRVWIEDELRKACAGPGPAPSRVHALEGYPPTVLPRLALRRRSGLIVMGTHGHSGIARAFSGSVTEAVVRDSPVPVLALHPRRSPLRIRRMLVPLNLEPYADQALEYALDWARGLKAGVSALYVAGPSDPGEPRLRLKVHLERLLGRRARAVRAVVREGEAEHEILEESAAGKYDLVVLSAHRRSFWRGGRILGSTAERVLRHCPVPTLCVPSGGGTR